MNIIALLGKSEHLRWSESARTPQVAALACEIVPDMTGEVVRSLRRALRYLLSCDVSEES